MRENIKILNLSSNHRLLDEQGNVHTPPKDWQFLPSGDAGITRKVSALGPFWRVQVKMGRRMISKGIWAPSEHILQAKEAILQIRESETYQKQRQNQLKRREKNQENYEKEFFEEVLNFLKFHPKYQEMEISMAKSITQHAIPVGSGTVARTQMIPIEERAAKAVIAWMRHQTTAYDHLQIARIKGERRKVRSQLAQQSLSLLRNYRNGETISAQCPLQSALRK